MLDFQFEVEFAEAPGEADDDEGESQGFHEPGQAVREGGRPGEAEQILGLVPDGRNDIASQRGRAGRFDDPGPGRVSLQVTQPPEQRKEGDGE